MLKESEAIMRVTVKRYQAVWEREILQVEVPDDTPPECVKAAVLEAIDDGGYETLDTAIVDTVDGFSTEIEAIEAEGKPLI